MTTTADPVKRRLNLMSVSDRWECGVCHPPHHNAVCAASPVVGEWRISILRLGRPLGGKGGAGVDSEAAVDVTEVLLDRLYRYVQGSSCPVIGVAATDEVGYLALPRGQPLCPRVHFTVISKDAGHRRP